MPHAKLKAAMAFFLDLCARFEIPPPGVFKESLPGETLDFTSAYEVRMCSQVTEAVGAFNQGKTTFGNYALDRYELPRVHKAPECLEIVAKVEKLLRNSPDFMQKLQAQRIKCPTTAQQAES